LSDSAAGDVPDYNEHGLGVSSAFLFGPLELGKVSKRPYAPITNIRILDADSARDNSLELYRALGVIEEVLLSKQYDFINLSLGPDLPIEDHDVHAWTSVIDEQLADGTTLMTIAAGNNGEADKESGNARIQVPSDCVNALAVGAADKESDEWLRAYYSAIGPGRIPGLVKPDLMAFGGVPGNYFHVLVEGNNPVLAPALGTSFAAPYLLRTAVGIKAYLGDSLSVLGIKTLLIHCSTPRNNPLIEVGWGKVPSDISNIILSPDGVSRIIYEGELTPAKYLRALIPLPEDLRGMVKIRATICFTTAVNPEDSGAYTRAGLEIHFRPNIEKVSPGSMHAQTKPFFSKGQYELEESLRELGGKWETVMSAEKNFRATTLKNPSFDIHCMARKNCGISTVKKKLRYALIISITTPKDLEVGQRILNRYPMLVPIRPRITIPTIQV